MRWIRFTVLTLAAAILQTSVVSLLGITAAQIRPNLLLILLVYFAVHAPAPYGILTSFAIGLGADLVGSGIGPQMLAFGLIGSLITELRKLIMLHSLLNQIIVVLTAGICSALLSLPLYAVKGCPLPTGRWQLILWGPLYSALLSPMLFWMIKFIMGHHAKRRHPLVS